jgi:hypothetical protein
MQEGRLWLIRDLENMPYLMRFDLVVSAAACRQGDLFMTACESGSSAGFPPSTPIMSTVLFPSLAELWFLIRLVVGLFAISFLVFQSPEV